MRPHIVLLAAALVAGPALAADLTVTVRNETGQPLADAVVKLRPSAGGAVQPIRFAWPLQMNQRNIAFDPYVLIVPVGSDVTFPNKDKVRHHVYSFSAAKKFELKLYGHEEARTVRFDKAGIVALGCNIHDQMIGYIFVTDSPFTARTNAAGEAVLRGLPGTGAGALSVWHPEMKARTPLTVAAASGRQTVTIERKPVALRHEH